MVGKRLGRTLIPGSRGERGKVLKIWGICYGEGTLKFFNLRKAREELSIWHRLFQVLKGILNMGPNSRIEPKDLYLYLVLLHSVLPEMLGLRA